MTTTGSTMTEKEFIPFTAEIRTPDFQKSLDFYTKSLGFEIQRINEERQFANLVYNNGQFLIQGQDEVPEPRGVGVSFRFLVNGDIQEYYDLVKDRGVKILKRLEKVSYGPSRFYIEDPHGYQIKFISR